METSNNPIWNNDEFDTWAGNIGRDLSYSIIQDNLDSIDQSLNSIYSSSLIPTMNDYKDILQQISFDSIDQSLNSIYSSSLLYTLNDYKDILQQISFDSIDQSLNSIYNSSLIIYNE